MKRATLAIEVDPTRGRVSGPGTAAAARAGEPAGVPGRPFDGVPVGLIRFAPDSRIADVNSTAVEILGYPDQQSLIGLHGVNLFADRDEAARLHEIAERGGVVRGHECRFRRQDGELVWVRVNARLVRDADGGVLGYEAAIEDLTERRAIGPDEAPSVERRKRAEEGLRQTEKLATMGVLLAGVAHELNNPLSVLIGQSGLLLQEASATALHDRASSIAAAAERCARIMRNFLALARKRPTERRPVGLNQVVLDAVELLAYQLRVSAVEVETRLADDLPAISADPNQLHQVVVNLVANALHAMRDTPPPRRLRVETEWERGRGRILLRVTDSGPGIPPDLRALIFEPFFTTKPVGEGTGLGLSLVRGIVEDHGGSIRVESEPGRGAAFVVKLPANAAAPETPADPGPAAAAVATPGGAILVVDDDPEIVSVLADMLVPEGHQVDTVTDGHVALERILAGRYDLVVSDLRMPHLDGPGLYREIRQRAPALVGRVVFVTGDALSPETRRFVEQCGAPTLAKPFDLDEVRRVIGRALAGPETRNFGDGPRPA